MDTLKILIVEDETITAQHLRITLEKGGHQVTGIARTYQEALNVAEQNPPELAIVDIHLDSQSIGSGIDIARELTTRFATLIIYLTANSEQATFQQAKGTLPSAYLLKPFRPEELLLHIDIAYQNYRSAFNGKVPDPLTNSLLVPTGKGHQKIDYDKILYLEAKGSYAQIRLIDGTSFIVSTNLSQLAQYFLRPNFLRLSRSHLVNLDFIKTIGDDELHLKGDGTVLPLPEAGRKQLLNRLTVIRTKSPGKR